VSFQHSLCEVLKRQIYTRSSQSARREGYQTKPLGSFIESLASVLRDHDSLQITACCFRFGAVEAERIWDADGDFSSRLIDFFIPDPSRMLVFGANPSRRGRMIFTDEEEAPAEFGRGT
jgi:hypothetical protein